MEIVITGLNLISAVIGCVAAYKSCQCLSEVKKIKNEIIIHGDNLGANLQNTSLEATNESIIASGSNINITRTKE